MIVSTSIRDKILINYNQIDLFSKYLNIDKDEIEYCLLNKNNKIRNPLREDNNPSLGFLYSSNKLIMKDWALDVYTGDIFHLVGLLLNKNCNISKDFIEICHSITNSNKIPINKFEQNISTFTPFTEFKTEYRDFTKYDLKYWDNLYVERDLLKIENVYLADRIFINYLLRPIYQYRYNNPGFVYLFDRINNFDIIKLYRPYELKINKFLTNFRGVFEAPKRLYKAKTLIIAKSYKDKLVVISNLYTKDNNSLLHSLFYSGDNSNIDIPEYCITSFMNENVRLDSDLVFKLKAVYENIIIYVDFDKVGILNGFYHHILYNIKTVFLGNKSLSINDFTSKEILNFFNKLLYINPNLVLYNNLLRDYIESNKADFKDKDISDYALSNRKDNVVELINKMFKI